MKFATGVAVGAVALFVGLWAWLIYHIHVTPTTLDESPDEEE